MSNIILQDELSYFPPRPSDGKARIVTLGDLLPKFLEELRTGKPAPGELFCEVTPHNTMRFDVHMAHISAVFNLGDTTKEELAAAISAAIIEAVVDTVGSQGNRKPRGRAEPNSKMLHRETISFWFD